VGRLWAYVCRTGLFAAGVLDAHTEQLSRIRETYVWDSTDSVSSHNDAIPANILFDGRSLWLIDWESAYRNGPLVDVATMLDNLAPSSDLESALVRSWLGRAPDNGLRARLTLIRALTRLYYAGVLLSASAATRERCRMAICPLQARLNSGWQFARDAFDAARRRPSTSWARCFSLRSSPTLYRRGSTPRCSNRAIIKTGYQVRRGVFHASLTATSARGETPFVS
jgi:hypothetical protein